MRMIDRIGDRYGRLTVIAQSPSRGKGVEWLCQCDCGNQTVVRSIAMVIGNTRSCGCLRVDAVVRRNLTHGMRHTPTYNSWASMIQRTCNPRHPSWKNYGGRGVTVCDRWLHSFEDFLADMGARPPGLSIDRIDNDGNYEPGNCRWATRSQQNSNTRRQVAAKTGTPVP